MTRPAVYNCIGILHHMRRVLCAVRWHVPMWHANWHVAYVDASNVQQASWHAYVACGLYGRAQ